ncbi:MAG: hypothetical protein ACUVV0_05495 [Anaerolineae bacterium]
MDLREEVSESMSGLEKLASSLPGYRGYKQKEVRRQADKLLRESLSTRFEEQRRRASELQVQLVNSGRIEFTDDLERAVMKLQRIVDRLKTASYGYAGFFDAVKVKEDQLDALYAFDNALMEKVTKVSAAVDKIATVLSGEGELAPAINELVATAQQINDTLDRREEAILQA